MVERNQKAMNDVARALDTLRRRGVLDDAKLPHGAHRADLVIAAAMLLLAIERIDSAPVDPIPEME